MAGYTNDARLKDCPICQGHAHIAGVAFSKGAVLYFAACDDKDCRMFEVPGRAHYRETVDEAIAAWNEMPRASEIKAERDELIRDILRDVRCRRSCGDCPHDEDEGCEFMSRAIEMGIEV